MKTNSFKPFRCADCEVGTVRYAKGRGRFRDYAWGVTLEVPQDVKIPQCDKCGETYVQAADIVELDRRMKTVFTEWAAHRLSEIVGVLVLRHAVTQRQIAAVCDVTPSHLSHILAGSAAPSMTLVRLLEAFASSQTEFDRHLSGGSAALRALYPFAVRQPGFAPVADAGAYEGTMQGHPIAQLASAANG
jgi:transcriptional regulator with XRE-family HTH domain